MKAFNILIIIIASAMQIADCYSQTVTDYDGNVYNTVQIGNQIWFKENLKVAHYSNGDSIPNGTGIGDYSAETEPKYYFYYNDDTANINIYGRLYTWFTATDSRNICPTGWVVPNDSQWNILLNYLGGQGAGGKMKEIGTAHWANPNTGATNSSGFTGLGGGVRNPNGFYNIRGLGTYWSSTYRFYEDGDAYELGYNSANLSPYIYGGYNKIVGISIRCLKDTTTNVNNLNYNNSIKVYPTPSGNNIKISIPAGSKEPDISIYNISGKEVLREQYKSNEIEINTTNFPKGVYLIKINSGSEVFNEKVVIN